MAYLKNSLINDMPFFAQLFAPGFEIMLVYNTEQSTDGFFRTNSFLVYTHPSPSF